MYMFIYYIYINKYIYKHVTDFLKTFRYLFGSWHDCKEIYYTVLRHHVLLMRG